MPRFKFIILFVLAAIVLLTTLFFHYLEKHFYKYDVKADYQYTFVSKASLEVPAEIVNDCFTLPQKVGNWDTGFLRIRVNSSFAGHIFEPYLDISSNGTHFRQYFELGAEGIRFINISPLSGQHLGKVTIKAHHLHLEGQNSRLLLFKNPAISGKRILVIAPHPDDAEIAAFGLYSYKDSYIITITDGSAGLARYEKFFPDTDNESSYELKAKLRVIDSLTVPSIGGVPPERCINLGYFDSTLKEMHDSPLKEFKAKHSKASATSSSRQYNLYQLPVSSGKSTWVNLVKDLSYLLAKLQPDIIVAPHPLLDAHPDHEYSSIALFEALKKTQLATNGHLFLYDNHDQFSKYYPFGKQSSVVTLPPFFLPTHNFISVCSYEMAREIQIEKIFALDAMHDLRLPPQQYVNDLPALMKELIHVSKISLEANTTFDSSYFRKAIRPNELFFVYPFDDADRLIGEFHRSPILIQATGQTASPSNAQEAVH